MAVFLKAFLNKAFAFSFDRADQRGSKDGICMDQM